MDILDRIKELCSKRGITVSQLENEIGVGKNSIYRWKNNIPSMEKIIKVADYFNVPTDYILGREYTPEWASKEDVIDLKKFLEDDASMSYGGEYMTSEEKQRVQDILTGLFFEIRKNKKQ